MGRGLGEEVGRRREERVDRDGSMVEGAPTLSTALRSQLGS